MRNFFLSSLISILILASNSPATAELMVVPGPYGNLEGEAIIVADAKAAIVIVPGAGQIDRDGNSGAALESDSYRMLAEGLAHAGFSTLRIDKRGSFGSRNAIAIPEDVSIASQAADLGLWQQALAERAGTRCVWIAGHNEGGLVALLAANGEVKPCGLLLLATPGRPIRELMIEKSMTDPLDAPSLAETDRILSDLRKRKADDPKMFEAALLQMIKSPIINPVGERHLVDLLGYDPAEIARKVTLPVLILRGDRDVQVTLVDSKLLASVMPQASVVELSGMTHMLKQDVPGVRFATYRNPKLPLAPEIVPTIADFIGTNKTP